MTLAQPTLDDLRRQIDRLDDELLRLLAERAAMAHEVRQVKAAGGRSTLQPAREALLMRRLAAAYRGGLPFRTLARIWREIIGGTLSLEGPVRAVVFAPVGRRQYWDMAKDHFGAVIPLTALDDPRAALRRAVAGDVTAAVLPMPAREPHPWWVDLLIDQDAAARIVYRLPFVEQVEEPGRIAAPAVVDERRVRRAALVVARADFLPTDRDRSYVGLVTIRAGHMKQLLAKLEQAGFTPGAHVDGQHPADTDSWLHMIEVDGYVGAADPRLERLVAASGGEVRHAVSLGGYPEPLAAIPGGGDAP